MSGQVNKIHREHAGLFWDIFVKPDQTFHHAAYFRVHGARQMCLLALRLDHVWELFETASANSGS